MKSIDKLREIGTKVKNSCFTGVHCDTVLELADEIEAEIAERYMLLPCDYDGEPLHIGDITNEGKVARMIVRDDGESSVYVYKLPNVLHEFACYEVEHVKPDPLKELMNDYLQERKKIVRKLESSLITLGEAESEEDACDKLTVYMPTDGFCSFGKRKEGGDE